MLTMKPTRNGNVAVRTRLPRWLLWGTSDDDHFGGRRRAFMATAAASCAPTASSRRNHLWRLHIERADLRGGPFDFGSSSGLEHGTNVSGSDPCRFSKLCLLDKRMQRLNRGLPVLRRDKQTDRMRRQHVHVGDNPVMSENLQRPERQFRRNAAEAGKTHRA